MKKYINKIKIQSIFGNLTRDRHVLLVIKDPQGNYLLGEKPSFYPQGIYRLAGGGIEKGETPIKAAIRESKEELTIEINDDYLEPIAQVTTKAQLNNKELVNTTFIFKLVNIDHLSLKPSDDIKGLKKLNRKEMSNLINKYKNLDKENLYEGDDGYKHYWNDYGKMYSFIHQLVLDLT